MASALTCFGIAHERLVQFHLDLQGLGLGNIVSNPRTKAVLFLAGLRYAHTFIAEKLTIGGPLPLAGC
jgi:hypothetical protein